MKPSGAHGHRTPIKTQRKNEEANELDVRTLISTHPNILSFTMNPALLCSMTCYSVSVFLLNTKGASI